MSYTKYSTLCLSLSICLLLGIKYAKTLPMDNLPGTSSIPSTNQISSSKRPKASSGICNWDSECWFYLKGGTCRFGRCQCPIGYDDDGFECKKTGGSRISGERCEYSFQCPKDYECKLDRMKQDHPSVLVRLEKTCQYEPKTSSSSSSSLNGLWIGLGVVGSIFTLVFIIFKLYENDCCKGENSRPLGRRRTVTPPVSPPVISSDSSMRNFLSRTRTSSSQHQAAIPTDPSVNNNQVSTRDTSILSIDSPPSYGAAVSMYPPAAFKNSTDFLEEKPPDYSAVQKMKSFQ